MPTGRRAECLLGVLLGCAVVALAAACSNDGSGTLRKHTYPPDFNYIPPEQLKSVMWQLAAEVRQLENAVHRAEAGEPVSPAAVAQLLDQMEQSAGQLGQGGDPSNHPRISQNVERLRADIRRARRGVGLDPPNYFWAGSLSGACRYCHAPQD